MLSLTSKFVFVLLSYITNHLMTGPVNFDSLESQCYP